MGIVDLTGQKYGKLTVICQGGRNKRNRIMWVCLCECGNEKIITGYSLRTGNSKSCGCTSAKNSKNIHNTTHGMSEHPLYSVWLGMKRRCNDKNDKRYKNYGGRGIVFSESWKRFENFCEDMLPNYQKGLQLERINNEFNYCKENCKWATRVEQANNNSRNRIETIDGINDTVANHARRMDIKYSKLYQQIRKNKL